MAKGAVIDIAGIPLKFTCEPASNQEAISVFAFYAKTESRMARITLSPAQWADVIQRVQATGLVNVPDKANHAAADEPLSRAEEDAILSGLLEIGRGFP